VIKKVDCDDHFKVRPICILRIMLKLQPEVEAFLNHGIHMVYKVRRITSIPQDSFIYRPVGDLNIGLGINKYDNAIASFYTVLVTLFVNTYRLSRSFLELRGNRENWCLTIDPTCRVPRKIFKII